MICAELHQVARLYDIDILPHPVCQRTQPERADRDLLSVVVGTEIEQTDGGIRTDAGAQRVVAREEGIERAGEVLGGKPAVAHAAFSVRLDAGRQHHTAIDVEGSSLWVP